MSYGDKKKEPNPFNHGYEDSIIGLGKWNENEKKSIGDSDIKQGHYSGFKLALQYVELLIRQGRLKEISNLLPNRRVKKGVEKKFNISKK